MGSGFAKKKKQAKQMQNQLMEMQSRIQTTEVSGTAGNGLVTVVLSGEHDLKSLEIKRECVDPDDIEGLTLLIKAAYQDALSKLKEQSMSQLPPGLPGGFGLGF
jgi:DNA-binding YbaB/EbfC family protein